MVADWPAVIVFGVATPLSLNSAPVNVIKEIVRSAVPVFEMVKFAFPVEPSVTVPNWTELLLREICGAGATAVAARFTTCELPSLLWAVIVPVTLPAVVGVTATVKFVDCPVARDIGNVAPGKLNCELETVAWVIETAVLPVFAMAIVWVVCLPTPTLPKFTLVGFSWKAA